MRLSKFFGQTLREAPSESDSASSQMLVRAGYVRQLAAGLYSYLPLAHRSLRKIEQILREEMDAIGGQEMCMPVVHPAEIWQESGRWYEIGDEMGRFQDRKGRELVLAMTHEEVVTNLCKSEIRSYRQLPQMVYHIQTKFRDEPRARGGLIRVREFVMKDSYTLDKDFEGLQSQYEAHYDAYHRIGARLGLNLVAVQSDPGMMGGKVAHEFMYISPVGEDSLAICEETGYASNLDVASFQKIPEPAGAPEPLTRVHTPGQSTIAKVADFCGVTTRQTGKMVFYMGNFGAEDPPRLIAACVRGDMEINELQLRYAVKAQALRPAEAEEIIAAGCVPGYASMCDIDRTKALLVVDDLIPESTNLIAGANERDWHYTGANYGRDFTADVIAPIALAYDGAPDPIDGKPLQVVRGIEVGNIFQLGTRYSSSMGATYTDEDGEGFPIVMGSYGIGVGRALACVAEEYSDDYGMDLPISVAPYHVILVSLGREGEVHEAAETLYHELLAAGVEILYDDRAVSPGVKFADADLRGIPLRCTVSSRSLKRGGAEFGRRRSKDLAILPLKQAVEQIQAGITECFNALNQRLEDPPTWASRSGSA
ncbi:MAG: proline--tRNA ligase [Rhodothermaceae bacterium]|nr:proline--tRNA ligase [Rhodothermaceae bacterium]MXZ57169.1 proline--tRNA ligase [Rhodothermaceae bacterium]MYB90867.1 proline--tRNA ligase [Rhodothermaceae bacterium]MYD68853.1 proline--tRNA ligase [Rhodothermaceae bacterium]MYG45036.1 proline--tRNA ligase [Rhodothermaceae bacterium]